jgi:hypothetical protein
MKSMKAENLNIEYEEGGIIDLVIENENIFENVKAD